VKNRAANFLFAAGVLAAGSCVFYSRSRPAPSAIAPEDAAWQRQEAALAGDTPETVARLETQLAAARARLPAAKAFDALVQGECPNWIVETRSIESLPEIEVRHYGMVFDHPKMSSWPDILETIRILCAEPGLTIDSLALTAAPDGADAFEQVEVNLTVQLRP
jgi:hypothetical protein